MVKLPPKRARHGSIFEKKMKKNQIERARAPLGPPPGSAPGVYNGMFAAFIASRQGGDFSEGYAIEYESGIFLLFFTKHNGYENRRPETLHAIRST